MPISEWTETHVPASWLHTDGLVVEDVGTGLRVHGTFIGNGVSKTLDQTLPWPPEPDTGAWHRWVLDINADGDLRLYAIQPGHIADMRYHTLAHGWRANAVPNTQDFLDGWAVRVVHRAWDEAKDGPPYAYVSRASGHVTRFLPGTGEHTIRPPGPKKV